MDLEEGDLVLCTVDRIVGTNVFVKLEDGNEGTITFSEIAPGRIRNIRDYVVPKKEIVCKILRISGDRIDLTFRRVNQEEKKKVLESHKQEKNYRQILKGVLGDKGKKVVEEILENGRVYDFLQEAKKEPKKLEKLVGKADSNKILEIISSQKQKTSIIKRNISLKTTENDGVNLIKNLIKEIKNIEFKYISAGKYSLRKEAGDLKKADQKMKETLTEIEKKAGKLGIEFKLIKSK